MLNFFEQMPSFSEFDQFKNPKHYQPLPDSWTLIVADLKSSTDHIALGRYKDVNLIAAGCISQVVKCAPKIIPYSFGGDGAFVAVPQEIVEQALKRLRAYSRFVRRTLDLELRLAAFSSQDFKAAGVQVQVAKFLNGRGVQGYFRGNGLEWAERELKDQYAHNQIHLAEDESSSFKFSNIFCRWQPIPSHSGKITTLIIKNNGRTESEQQAIYEEIGLLTKNFYSAEQNRPVKVDDFKLISSFDQLRTECMLKCQSNNTLIQKLYAWRCLVLHQVVKFMIHFFNVKKGEIDFNRYRQDMTHSSDYRKYDGLLRMVVDLSPIEINGLRRTLEIMEQQGKISFGLHMSDTALMTCMVFSAVNHIHFIDGGEGGYMKAANILKAKLEKQEPQYQAVLGQ
ncbi:DUF3095 family protein [Pseudobacteriovorax antillogorgiicola]|uniref:DUF3095 domain-containing protein n=1 Tax=Pseudobacteriovorax antillogorgiicola TaxID=1513793 RepID=A0A1Y6BBK8_9BACT|nr:DUF3095 family protein [Pseudobacteriovorax antillogorgiicola]TCS57307.1 DUF3095 family protein [Pseudobacteriovorax antillogorgiicola]SMF02739.1 Protein of unknown function [Pseudobacteriovorax antillogorgiicola]